MGESSAGPRPAPRPPPGPTSAPRPAPPRPHPNAPTKPTVASYYFHRRRAAVRVDAARPRRGPGADILSPGCGALPLRRAPHSVTAAAAIRLEAGLPERARAETEQPEVDVGAPGARGALGLPLLPPYTAT